MEIIKRTGQKETFRSEKIADAIATAFKSVGTEVSAVKALTAEITEELKRLYETERRIHIETIQDLVEKTLIKHNYPAEVKSFILYRESRAKKRAARKRITDTFSSLDLDGELKSVQKDFPEEEYSLDALYHKYSAFKKEGVSDADALSTLIRAAVEMTTQEAPRWEYIASRFLMVEFRIKLKAHLERLGIQSFYEKIRYLTQEGLYGSYISEHYSKA